MILAAWFTSGLLRNYPLLFFLYCFLSLGKHRLPMWDANWPGKTHFLYSKLKVQPAHCGWNITLQPQCYSRKTATILSFLCLAFFLSILHFFFCCSLHKSILSQLNQKHYKEKCVTVQHIYAAGIFLFVFITKTHTRSRAGREAKEIDIYLHNNLTLFSLLLSLPWITYHKQRIQCQTTTYSTTITDSEKGSQIK